jgi:methyl-accepting chemotaxis protein
MRFTVAKKIGLGFAVVVVLMIISAASAYLKAGSVDDVMARTTSLRMPSLSAGKDLRADLNQSLNKTRQVVLAGGDPGRLGKAKAALDAAHEALDKDISRIEELAPHFKMQANRDRLASIKEGLTKLHSEEDEAIHVSQSGEKDAVLKAGDMVADVVSVRADSIRVLLVEMIESFEKLAQEDQVEASANLRSMIWTLWICTALAVLIAVAVAMYISRAISVAAGAALGSAEAIAGGNLTSAELIIASRDELGDLAAALNKMQAKLRGIIVSIGDNARQVATAGEEFSAVSQQITANSEETSTQANVVSAATEQINRNLQTVATSTEEMSASISEIAKNAGQAAKVAGQAMQAATETDATVTKLGVSSAEIGEVIKVITSIAQQTNLLALNATIEAARAGEAGKGFAVVANEVKGLAKQTAKATEDISHRIAAIQTDAKSAVEAIKIISGIIGQVNEISTTIATAVEEQSATTAEMSRNVSEAAKGSSEVARNISGVAHAAQNTSSGATESQRAAQQLAHMSTELRELVGQFKY